MAARRRSVDEGAEEKTTERVFMEDVLKCPICLNHFDTPRALACLHTFCEPCLAFYITDAKRSVKDGRLERIECPVCHYPTVPPDLLKHPHAMVKDFPLNYFILPSMATPRDPAGRDERRGRNVNFTQSCGSCTARGSAVEALAYCRDCEDFQCQECVENHSKIKMLIKHKIVGLDRDGISGSDMSSAFAKHNRCLRHQSQDVRFYCVNHDALLCSDCAVECHKACELIQEFDDMGLKLKQGEETQQLRDNLKGLQSALNDMVEAIRSNNYGIQRETEEIPKRIQAMKSKVLRMFQYLEDATEQSIRVFQEEQGKKNSDKAFRCRQLIAAMEASGRSLDTVLEQGSYSQMFLTFHKLKEQLQEYDELVKSENQTLECTSIQLKMEDAVDVVINETQNLGNVILETRKPDLNELPPLLFARREASPDDITPELVNSGHCKDSTDVNIKKDCIAATFIDRKIALILEVKNRTWFSYNLAFINADTLEEILSIDLKRGPRNLVSIDTNNLAVTYPDSGFIEFYLCTCTTKRKKKKQMKFDLDHTLKCDIRDTVIARYSKEEFAIGTHNYLGTMTHDGVMKRLFYFSVSLRIYASDFWSTQLKVEHIAVDAKQLRLYVACSKPHKVYSFTPDGGVMFEHPFKNAITSLDLDKDGNICVISGDDSMKDLFQVSPNTGKLRSIVATEAKKLELCCFNQSGADFYLLANHRNKINIDKYCFKYTTE